MTAPEERMDVVNGIPEQDTAQAQDQVFAEDEYCPPAESMRMVRVVGGSWDGEPAQADINGRCVLPFENAVSCLVTGPVNEADWTPENIRVYRQLPAMTVTGSQFFGLRWTNDRSYKTRSPFEDGVILDGERVELPFNEIDKAEAGVQAAKRAKSPLVAKALATFFNRDVVMKSPKEGLLLAGRMIYSKKIPDQNIRIKKASECYTHAVALAFTKNAVVTDLHAEALRFVMRHVYMEVAAKHAKDHVRGRIHVTDHDVETAWMGDLDGWVSYGLERYKIIAKRRLAAIALAVKQDAVRGWPMTAYLQKYSRDSAEYRRPSELMPVGYFQDDFIENLYSRQHWDLFSVFVSPVACFWSHHPAWPISEVWGGCGFPDTTVIKGDTATVVRSPRQFLNLKRSERVVAVCASQGGADEARLGSSHLSIPTVPVEALATVGP